uniref:MCM C-terminal AAA(+) ATPase domain-containing protein n=1 Tax=Lactuca sativa TaxID=4236 RepID=A0A9R1UV06_LACSA|nr:hypothetical protein LSAT_V11C800450540 [Lactuca sativa]
MLGLAGNREMKLLAEANKPGSLINNYVTQLSCMLSSKATNLVSLQARLSRFHHHLKEILSHKSFDLNEWCFCEEVEINKEKNTRAAIHEAMEQQTISITKAGITTILNSRTSVLAATNPPSGRYDDLKTAQDNIDLQTTILSRFDLIFIVEDINMFSQDKMVENLYRFFLLLELKLLLKTRNIEFSIYRCYDYGANFDAGILYDVYWLPLYGWWSTFVIECIVVKKGDSDIRMVVDACCPHDIREETDLEYFYSRKVLASWVTLISFSPAFLFSGSINDVGDVGFDSEQVDSRGMDSLVVSCLNCSVGYRAR